MSKGPDLGSWAKGLRFCQRLRMHKDLIGELAWHLSFLASAVLPVSGSPREKGHSTMARSMEQGKPLG